MADFYDYSIRLRENPAISNVDLADLTSHFPVWRHSTKDIGGCWDGDGEYTGSVDAMDDFFLNNLGKRIAVGGAGVDWYEGMIVQMEYTKNGQRFTRAMDEMANRIKIIYTRVGDNLFANGDVEGGAWTQVGTPSTHETTTAWFTQGGTAMHVVAAASGDGTQIETGVTIVANRAYVCSVMVEVIAGTWTLTVDDGAGATICERSTSGAGREWLQVQIPDSNAVTSVRAMLTGSANADEIYADGAFLRLAPTRAETAWTSDDDSIDSYGRVECVFLEGQMTDDEADALAARLLAERAWMRTESPMRGGTFDSGQSTNALKVTTRGLAFTLSWRHTTINVTDQASDHIANLLDESEFFTSASALIDTNTTAEVLVDNTNPTTLWRAIEKVIKAGDASGNEWMGGCYPNAEFRYEARPTGIQYEYSAGVLRYYGGGLIHPLEFAPGWCWMADMPTEPTPAGAQAIDDPRRVWLNEAWVIIENGRMRLEWSRERVRQ